MRSLVPAFMVVALALLLVGGAGAQKFARIAFHDGSPSSEQATERPNASSLSVRLTL